MMGYSSTYPELFPLAVWIVFFMFTYLEQVLGSPRFVALRRYLPLQWLVVWLALGAILIDKKLLGNASFPLIVFFVGALAFLCWLHLRRPPSLSGTVGHVLIVATVTVWICLLLVR